MLDTKFPRIHGDVGHAATWPFPVRYRIVSGADPARIMGPEPDPTLLDPFIHAARDLEAEGVRLITTSCGFLAAFQRELAAAVGVPMLTSALLQLPLATDLVGPNRRVAVLTERPNLTARHFSSVGFPPGRGQVVVRALPNDAVFPTIYIDGALEADPSVLEDELVRLAEGAIREDPDVGALVLECTNFVPFSNAIRRATGLPVFDLYTLVMLTRAATPGPARV